MTKPLIFDTDCLSAFLWVNQQSLLVQLYPGQIVIPSEVLAELSFPGIAHLKARINLMIKNKDVKLASIQTGTEEYQLYRKMTAKPEPGHVIIGKGEAAAIALAKVQDGIVASNNLRDVTVYVSEMGLQLKTTGEILKDALDAFEEPWKERSKNQQDKFNKKVVADSSIFLTRTFAPQMQTEIRNMIGQDVSVCMDPNDKEQCSVNFYYKKNGIEQFYSTPFYCFYLN